MLLSSRRRRNASPIVFAIDGWLGVVLYIHSPGVVSRALVASEFCRGEVEDANIVCIAAVSWVGAVVATAIAMASFFRGSGDNESA